MKKIVSIITAAIMAVMLFVPAFAANTVIFNITLVSENDTEAVITFDYVGGSSFNSLDFEITLSDRLSVVSGGKSAGLKKFQSEIEDNGQMMIAQLNTQKKPIMGAMATTAPFDGKVASDLFTLTLKKSTSASLQEGDVKVNVTNCAYSESAGSTKDLSATITSDLGKPVTSGANPQSQATQSPASDDSANEDSSDVSNATNENGEALSSADEQNGVENTNESVERTVIEKSSGIKKYITIGAVVLCVLLVVIAVVIVVTKKSKKNNADKTDISDSESEAENADDTQEKESE